MRQEIPFRIDFYMRQQVGFRSPFRISVSNATLNKKESAVKLKPSYWILGRKKPSVEGLSEDLHQSWKEIVRSGAIRPNGKNLDCWQLMSLLCNYVFLSYGKPYKLLVPGPGYSPTVEFDTDQLLHNGALTGETLDGGLWANLENDAYTVVEELAPSTPFDPEDLMDIVRGALDGDCLPSSYGQLLERFCMEFSSLVEDRFKREALSGESARSLLFSLQEEDIDIGIEIYFPESLPLSMAMDFKVPSHFPKTDPLM